MTDVEKIDVVLREAGAAYVEFDDSATDGQCWIVEQKTWWYESLAKDILAALTKEEPRPDRRKKPEFSLGYHVEGCHCLESDGAVLNVDLRCEIL